MHVSGCWRLFSCSSFFFFFGFLFFGPVTARHQYKAAYSRTPPGKGNLIPPSRLQIPNVHLFLLYSPLLHRNALLKNTRNCRKVPGTLMCVIYVGHPRRGCESRVSTVSAPLLSTHSTPDTMCRYAIYMRPICNLSNTPLLFGLLSSKLHLRRTCSKNLRSARKRARTGKKQTIAVTGEVVPLHPPLATLVRSFRQREGKGKQVGSWSSFFFEASFPWPRPHLKIFRQIFLQLFALVLLRATR